MNSLNMKEDYIKWHSQTKHSFHERILLIKLLGKSLKKADMERRHVYHLYKTIIEKIQHHKLTTQDE